MAIRGTADTPCEEMDLWTLFLFFFHITFLQVMALSRRFLVLSAIGCECNMLSGLLCDTDGLIYFSRLAVIRQWERIRGYKARLCRSCITSKPFFHLPFLLVRLRLYDLSRPLTHGDISHLSKENTPYREQKGWHWIQYSMFEHKYIVQ
jgi:hypothetical protein